MGCAFQLDGRHVAVGITDAETPMSRVFSAIRIGRPGAAFVETDIRPVDPRQIGRLIHTRTVRQACCAMSAWCRHALPLPQPARRCPVRRWRCSHARPAALQRFEIRRCLQGDLPRLRINRDKRGKPLRQITAARGGKAVGEAWLFIRTFDHFRRRPDRGKAVPPRCSRRQSRHTALCQRMAPRHGCR